MVGLLRYADALSRFAFLKEDSRLEEVVDLLVAKQDDARRWRAESIYRYWGDFSVGQKREPSGWVTPLATQVIKQTHG